MGAVHQEEAQLGNRLLAAGYWLLAAGSWLLATGCAAPAPRDPWPSDAPSLRDTVGWLDERPVTYGDVARYLRGKEPEVFTRNLEGLVLERATRAEAEPLGIAIPEPLLLRRVEARIREWEAELQRTAREQGAGPVDPALWLQRTAGISLSDFRRTVRRHTEVELLQDRLLRYEQRTSPRVEAAVLVVEDAEEAERLAAQTRSGADFAELARRHSKHATAAQGGAFGFPLLEADVNDAAVREALFAARPGDVVGPFPTEGGGRVFHQLYRVAAVGSAERRPYAELRERIEAGLEKRPVPVGEYERWRRRILLRHGFVAAPAPGDAG